MTSGLVKNDAEYVFYFFKKNRRLNPGGFEPV